MHVDRYNGRKTMAVFAVVEATLYITEIQSTEFTCACVTLAGVYHVPSTNIHIHLVLPNHLLQSIVFNAISFLLPCSFQFNRQTLWTSASLLGMLPFA